MALATTQKRCCAIYKTASARRAVGDDADYEALVAQVVGWMARPALIWACR